MLNLAYNSNGILMLIWYTCLRWTLLPNNVLNTVNINSSYTTSLGWAYTPINLFTAFLSFMFLIPALLMPEKTQNKYFYCAAAFLWLRNMYYTLEDLIDLFNYPSWGQAAYVLIDLSMALFVSLWLFKYYKDIKRVD